jgi:hypothetical protein
MSAKETGIGTFSVSSVSTSVADPDPNPDPHLPDPHVFGPPGSGSGVVKGMDLASDPDRSIIKQK